MAYKTDEIQQPFWAETSGAASGRDPLAIQNSSVVIYAKMMPGITNVTNRVRYIGFYCWLFELVMRRIEARNSLVEQIRYLRRAELLLAYVMVDRYPDVTGVSGSSYAAKYLQERIDLKIGADLPASKESSSGSYWKYGAGIFGQYYSGAVRDLNLINHPGGEINIYTPTAKGKELALAFEKNIGIEVVELFWQSIDQGEITRSQLDKLSLVSLNQIPRGSDEAKIYAQTLMTNDDRSLEPTYFRRETLKMMLHFYCNQTETKTVLHPTEAFLRSNYSSQIHRSTLDANTATAWYLYEINELLHVAFEHIHVCFLYELDTTPKEIDSCLESLVENAKKVITTLVIDSDVVTVAEFIASLHEVSAVGDAHNLYTAMQQAFRSRELGECLWNSITTILRVYSDCNHHCSQLQSFAQLPEFNFNRKGYAIELMEELVQQKSGQTLSQYVRSLLLQAINLHTFSSYGKSRIGQGLVHNYIMEDQLVWRLRETLPNRTSPRLQNALQFMTDIGWVSREHGEIRVTDSGMDQIS